MKRILFVVVVGCFLFSSCGDFLEEYSKDLVYASSCEDLDEIIIGNGYMKRMRIRNMPITGKMNCITRIYT